MESDKNNTIKWDFSNQKYGDHKDQILDIKIPEKKNAHAIVYIHGGAYMVGDKSQYPSFLAAYSKNSIIAAINYRMVKDSTNVCMEDILSDVNAAMAKITGISGAHNVSIKDFILLGHSAGGHIALLYSYKYPRERTKVSACLSLAGPTDFTDDLSWSRMTMWGENFKERLAFFSVLGSLLTGREIKLKQAYWTLQKNYAEFKKYILDISPVAYVSEANKNPPTLLVHARSDNQVPYSNAVRLKTALAAVSVPHKLITPVGTANNHMLGGECHGDNSPVFYENQPWVAKAMDWLEKHLE